MSIITQSSFFDIVAIFVVAIAGFIVYLKHKLTYWERLNIPTITPSLPFGNTKDLMLGKKSFGEQFCDLYVEFKKRGHTEHGGVYFSTNPFYLVINPELAKRVMQNDFQHFVNHGNYFNEDVDPLSGHLFNLEDDKWKNMRAKLTPTFTSGKIKMMFQTLADCTVGLKDIINESANKHTPVEIKEVLGRFTTDIIGSVAFGLECNSLKDPDAEFRKYGRRVFEMSNFDRLKLLLTFALPHSILRALRLRITKRDVENFFMNAVRDTVDYREKNNINRNDFMQLLVQLKNQGFVNDEVKLKTNNESSNEKRLTMNELSAQAFVFFLGGFETSSTTMTYALYELSTNPDVQEKLRDEINTVLAAHKNKLTYEAVMEMTYLDKVINETLRMHPPVPTLLRRCNKDYKIPDTSIVLPKGLKVAIPILGIQTDPEYYPNPEKFDPERFSEENKKSRPTFTWLPFGEGSRVCIGLRFGMLQTKIGLAALLQDYKIKLSHKTTLPIRVDKNAIVTTIDGGLWLDIYKT